MGWHNHKRGGVRKMGMFDYVQCDAPLPDGYKSDSFQTKDFDSYMIYYHISADGTLWVRDGYEEEPQESPFHGWFNFYDFGDDKNWYSYAAKFTDGKLQEIKLAGDHWKNHVDSNPPSERG